MSDPQLKKRATTAAVLIVVLLAILSAAAVNDFGRWMLAGLAIIINGFCAFEFARLSANSLNGTAKYKIILLYSLFAFLPSLYALCSFAGYDFCLLDSLQLRNLSIEIFAVSAFSLLAALAYMIYSGAKSLDDASAIGSEVLTGVIIVALGGASFLSLAIQTNASKLVLWLLLVICLTDTCAYFTGKKFGGKKLSPYISPNKTFSGSTGGLVGGTLAGLIFGFLLSGSFSLPQLLFVTLLSSLVSQLGDLSKSYIKRLHGVKDTGTLLPGHGGVLDRVDGIIAASIVLNFFVVIRAIA